MINCNKCQFSINKEMSYAIKANTCPACGSKIMSNDYLKVIKHIERDLLSNGFSFKEDTMRNLSIFFANKLYKNIEEPTTEDSVEEASSDEIKSFEELEDHASETIDSILSETEDIGAANLSDTEEEDEDDRVSRLRRLAKNNKILGKRGASVRRVND